MFINRPKAELIIDIFAAQKDNSVRNIMRLLDVLIDETRISNDSVEGNEIYRNQGKIQAYQALKEIIERGLPASNR